MNKKNKKNNLHPNNPHRTLYDFQKLIKNTPNLEKFIKLNPRGEQTIDFSESEAVKLLNKALLKAHYGIEFWDIPEGFLCPPIPGRADYIHYIAELLDGEKRDVKVLDIGTGANLIYPILGTQTFGWSFVATDIDEISIKAAESLINLNKNLKGKIELKLQKDKDKIFTGVIGKDEYFDLTMCNPPFHSSLQEAMEANKRKINNLSKDKMEPKESKFNFGGQKAELWCNGGELLFLKKMAKDSVNFASKVGWFTTLVSKGENVKPMEKLLNKLGAKEIKIINMSQGQKISRVLVWSFATSEFVKVGELNGDYYIRTKF